MHGPSAYLKKIWGAVPQPLLSYHPWILIPERFKECSLDSVDTCIDFEINHNIAPNFPNVIMLHNQHCTHCYCKLSVVKYLCVYVCSGV